MYMGYTGLVVDLELLYAGFLKKPEREREGEREREKERGGKDLSSN